MFSKASLMAISLRSVHSRILRWDQPGKKKFKKKTKHFGRPSRVRGSSAGKPESYQSGTCFAVCFYFSFSSPLPIDDALDLCIGQVSESIKNKWRGNVKKWPPQSLPRHMPQVANTGNVRARAADNFAFFIIRDRQAPRSFRRKRMHSNKHTDKKM